MANVLIQPSFGNAQARRNYAATLENPTSFVTGALRDALSEDEFKELSRLHPDGTARFWATPANQDKKMDKLARGDVVLFTGGGRVRAIGEVGASFRNADAGDAMWPPASGEARFVSECVLTDHLQRGRDSLRSAAAADREAELFWRRQLHGRSAS